MQILRKTNYLMKIISVIVAGIFLCQQIAWAGDLTTPIADPTTDEQSPGIAPEGLMEQQASKLDLIAQQNDIENFQTQAAGDPTSPYGNIRISISLNGSGLVELNEYYDATFSRLKRKEMNIADSEGNIAYEYMDEDRDSGVGRITVAERQTADAEGIIAYTYEYHSNLSNISRKEAYSDRARQKPVTAFEYSLDGAVTVSEAYYTSGRLHTKSLSGGTSYEYSDESWNGNNPGKLIKKARPDGSYETFESYYEGTDQAGQIKDHDMEGVLLINKEFGISGQLVEMSIFDSENRAFRQIYGDGTYTESYFDIADELVTYYEYDTYGGFTIFDAANNIIYEFNPQEAANALLEENSLVSITNNSGDIVKYQNGTIFSVAFQETDATLTSIELNDQGALENAILKYADGTIDVIYGGETIQTMFTNDTLIRYRENNKATEYSPGNGITNFYYFLNDSGDVTNIRTDNKQDTGMYEPDGTPLWLEMASGKTSEFINSRLAQIITADGNTYHYEYIDEDTPRSQLVEIFADTSVPAIIFYDANGKISEVSNINGDTVTYSSGLISNVTHDTKTTTYDYVFGESEKLEELSVDRSGLKRIYDSLGNLRSVTLDNDTKIVYENGELRYLEKADGTTMEEITFTETGKINDALISYPDGSVAVYSDGELLEIISRTGDRTDFSAGNIQTITLNDAAVYDWSYEDDLIKIYDHAFNEYRWYSGGILQKIEERDGTQLVTEYTYNTDGKLATSSISSPRPINSSK